MALDWNLTIGGAQFELQGLVRVRLVLTAEAARLAAGKATETALRADDEEV